MGTFRIKKSSPRMSATDAGFLYLDRPHAQLHVASVVLVDGRVTAEALVRRLEGRIHRVPRYAQRAMRVPLALGHPTWEDAPDFDARDHVHRWSLPAPGGEGELAELCARLLGQPLDRDRPLWDMHVIEGVHEGRTAVLLRAHHCMIDGVSGVRLLEEILDVEPTTSDDPARLPSRRRLPGSAARARHALTDGLRRQVAAVGGGLGALVRPAQARHSARRLRDAAYSALHLTTDDIPKLPWNQPIGPRRALRFTRLPIDGVRRIRQMRGGTLNDVVLCVLAGGLHRYLESLGISTRSLEVIALVPVSLRSADEAHVLGNRISALLVPLAVDLEREVPRLNVTCAITERLKQRAAWNGIDALLALLEQVPASLVAAVARSMPISRIANLVATNVPGPRETRYLCGERVEAIYPIVPIADRIGLGLAVFSYDGTLYVGLNADPDLVPGHEKLCQGIEEAFAALLAGAQPAGRTRPRNARVAQLHAAGRRPRAVPEPGA
jgi:WS/DGAT/MGAT family acyltransferase